MFSLVERILLGTDFDGFSHSIQDHDFRQSRPYVDEGNVCCLPGLMELKFGQNCRNFGFIDRNGFGERQRSFRSSSPAGMQQAS
jgi:hypothetical protein